MPKRWFDSAATAEKAFAGKTSPEAMVKLLSSENLRLLHLIATKPPGSVRELANAGAAQRVEPVAHA
jgi:predicted transcriptional regulator